MIKKPVIGSLYWACGLDMDCKPVLVRVGLKEVLPPGGIHDCIILDDGVLSYSNLAVLYDSPTAVPLKHPSLAV